LLIVREFHFTLDFTLKHVAKIRAAMAEGGGGQAKAVENALPCGGNGDFGGMERRQPEPQ
jgi:hypothetical protein